jgi:hypothetical protein
MTGSTDSFLDEQLPVFLRAVASRAAKRDRLGDPRIGKVSKATVSSAILESRGPAFLGNSYSVRPRNDCALDRLRDQPRLRHMSQRSASARRWWSMPQGGHRLAAVATVGGGGYRGRRWIMPGGVHRLAALATVGDGGYRGWRAVLP